MRLVTTLTALTLLLPIAAHAGGVPLLDATGASHGSVAVSLTRGTVRMKITGVPRLPATVNTGAATFTAHYYKAYLASATDSAVEIFLGDVYPNGAGRAVRKVALAGDVSQMGLNRVTVTAFSSDGQQAFDVLTAAIAP